MDFFQREDFFLLYKKHLNRSIIRENGIAVGIKKEKFPSLIELGPSGTWTSLNYNKTTSLLTISKSLKTTNRVIFTDIAHILSDSDLKDSLKYYNKETWFEADIDLKVSDIESVIKSFKRRVKRNLKKSLLDKDLVFFEDSTLIDEFMKLHIKHAETKNYSPYSREFIIDLLKCGGKLFFIKHKNTIIGSHIMLIKDNISFQYIHALADAVYEMRADDFFRYKLIEFAYNQKCDVIKFGGTPLAMNSLLDYKKGFGSTIREYNIYTFYNSFITKKIFQLKDRIIK